MSRWSKLQKELYLIIDPTIDFQIHCAVYPMRSRYGNTDLPRYWITLGKEIIFDYPKQFVTHDGLIRNFKPHGITKNYPYKYPYKNDVSDISDLIREYIDTPVSEIMTKHFENDYWGLANILRAADRRIGQRRLDVLRRRIKNQAAQKILELRIKPTATSNQPPAE